MFVILFINVFPGTKMIQSEERKPEEHPGLILILTKKKKKKRFFSCDLKII